MRGLIYGEDGLELLTDLEVRGPGAGEVWVRIESAGLCHSDISVIDRTIPFPPPVVLGHEGAGVVEAIGEGVTHVAEGDHVVLSTLGNCGACAACETGRPTHCVNSFSSLPKPFTHEGESLYQFANTSTFTERTVVKAAQAVPIDKDVSFDVAALIGCGVITGVGAVLNRAQVKPGQSAAVLGVGGIGLNVLQGLRLANAGPVIAIDTNPSKEALALQFGATEFILAGEGVDTGAAVKEICPSGVTWAFECVGSTALIRQSIDLLDRGGSCVIIGVPPLGAEASFMVASLYHDKSIMGCRYGAARPNHDFPLIVDLYKRGDLLLDELVTRTYPLADYQQALDDMHAGTLARGVFHL